LKERSAYVATFIPGVGIVGRETKIALCCWIPPEEISMDMLIMAVALHLEGSTVKLKDKIAGGNPIVASISGSMDQARCFHPV
jgi:hypothetical protein